MHLLEMLLEELCTWRVRDAHPVRRALLVMRSSVLSVQGVIRSGYFIVVMLVTIQLTHLKVTITDNNKKNKSKNKEPGKFNPWLRQIF